MIIMNLTEAKAKFSAVVDTQDTVVITRRNRLVKAIVPYEEYQAFQQFQAGERYKRSWEIAQNVIQGKMDTIDAETIDQAI